MTSLARNLVSFAAGLIFGLGLAISGMLDPARVRGFLDISGAWDPSLAFVLGGAVTVSAIGYAVSRGMKRPVLGDAFRLPERTDVDGSLVFGAGLFGIGWGIAGLCPGPAVASLVFAMKQTGAFAFAMLVGMIFYDRMLVRFQRPQVAK